MEENNLYSSIAEAINKKGINCTIGTIYDLMAVCKSWYRGNVDDFHYYTQTLVDGTTCQMERLTMNMPKKICEDFSKLCWSEKVEISLDSDKKTKRLWEVLDSKENSFTINFPAFIERAFALGTGVLVEYKKDDKTLIDYIDGELAIPYKYTNSYIYGLITISQFVRIERKREKYYTHLTFHEFENKKYIKYNELYVSDNPNELGKEIKFGSMFPDVENPVIYENVDTPHFQILKPPIANNFDTGSPLGISILANHIDKFKAIDTKYDSFCNEFELGKKMVLVDRTAVKGAKEVDAQGNIRDVTYFDKKNKVFLAINGMENQPVKEIDFKLRTSEHIDAINADLNYLSAGLGLGAGFYKFDGNSLKTATEVISENSEAFRTKKTYEAVIKDVVYDLVKAICQLEGINTKSINVVFSDNIVEDENTLIERGLKLYREKVISLDTFMEKYLYYDEEQIKQEKEKLLTTIPVVIDLLENEIIDREKAMQLLLGNLDEKEKARILANLGEVYPEEFEEEGENEEETPKEE